LSDFELKDFFNKKNALTNGAGVDAVLESLNIEWDGRGTRVRTNDSTNNFSLNSVENTATMEWSAHNANGFRFVSDPAATSTSFCPGCSRAQRRLFLKEDDAHIGMWLSRRRRSP
jgi:hypothetical protein